MIEEGVRCFISGFLGIILTALMEQTKPNIQAAKLWPHSYYFDRLVVSFQVFVYQYRSILYSYPPSWTHADFLPADVLQFVERGVYNAGHDFV